MKIRVAQRGLGQGDHPPTTVEEVYAAFQLVWVELDGVRLADINAVQFRASIDGIGTPTLEVGVNGVVELVYVDAVGAVLPRDGEPLEVEKLIANGPLGLDATRPRDMEPAPMPAPQDPDAASALAVIESAGDAEEGTFFVEGMLYGTEDPDGDWPVEWNYAGSGQLAYASRTPGEAAAFIAGFKARHVMRIEAAPSIERSRLRGGS